MMRVLKFLYLSIKILLLPVVVALLIYFRAVIFQPHVNQYADDAQLYLEQKYDISIPVHVVENSENELDLDRQAENSAFDSTTDTLLNNSSSGQPSSVSDISVDELVNEKTGSATDKPRVVEQEIFIILNNDGRKKSVSDNTVDATKQEVVASAVEPEITDSVEANVEVSTNEVTDKVSQINEQEVTNSKSKVIDPAIMEKLSDTVDIINRKVDMLFNINELEKDIKISSANSDDFAVIKKPKVKPEYHTASVAAANKKPAENAREMLLIARQTFWNGNPLDSEKLYLDLVALQENNPNVYGELGNVYYSQGKWEQAGKAYYEAAIRLLDLKQTQQVNYLLRVIQGLDSESAKKLKLKISG